jgi:mono/diheme cytochrome c family protein
MVWIPVNFGCRVRAIDRACGGALELTKVNATQRRLVDNQSMSMCLKTIATAAAVAVLIFAFAAQADDAESAFRGKRLAEANCAGCHALAQHDKSTLAIAPPLREIGSRFAPKELRDMLHGKVFLEHAAMPDFEPDDGQAADLANSILSISENRSEAHGEYARRLQRM